MALDTAETIVQVTDRKWETMKDGAMFEKWPGQGAPEVGSRVTAFDCELDFTQHVVTRVEGQRVWIGPAIPFAE